MPNEWIPVVDTAVKIGLGALISGVFTYLGIRLSKKSEINKFMLEHKVKLIEQIVIDVDIYFFAYHNLINTLSGITVSKSHDSSAISFTADEFLIIKKEDKVLVDSWSQKNSIISKLRLLRVDLALKELNDYSKHEHNFRNLIFNKKSFPNYNKLAEIIKTSITLEENFHKALADFYKNP